MSLQSVEQLVVVGVPHVGGLVSSSCGKVFPVVAELESDKEVLVVLLGHIKFIEHCEGFGVPNFAKVQFFTVNNYYLIT